MVTLHNCFQIKYVMFEKQRAISVTGTAIPLSEINLL